MGWETKQKWSAEQWRTYRRSKGIPPKADMPTILPPHIARQGRQLVAMMMLPMLDWSEDLFEDITMTKDTTAPLAGKKPQRDTFCMCGCKLPHNMAVSRVVGNSGNRKVLWYRTILCRNKDAGIIKGPVL